MGSGVNRHDLKCTERGQKGKIERTRLYSKARFEYSVGDPAYTGIAKEWNHVRITTSHSTERESRTHHCVT